MPLKNEHSVLQNCLNATFKIFQKTLQYHWNIKGETFYSDHKLLEKHYEELLELSDDIAETGQTLDLVADLNISSSKLKISPALVSSSRNSIMQDLLESYAIILAYIETIKDKVAHEQSSAIISKMSEVLSQHHWMLKSSL